MASPHSAICREKRGTGLFKAAPPGCCSLRPSALRSRQVGSFTESMNWWGKGLLRATQSFNQPVKHLAFDPELNVLQKKKKSKDSKA